MRSGGLSWNRTGRNINVFVDMSTFESTGTLGNTLNTRGVQGAATIGIPLTRTVSVQGGGQYQKYDRTSLYAFDQRRVFVSLRYSNPTLLSFAK